MNSLYVLAVFTRELSISRFGGFHKRIVNFTFWRFSQENCQFHVLAVFTRELSISRFGGFHKRTANFYRRQIRNPTLPHINIPLLWSGMD